MSRIISNDGMVVTVETNDGRILRVPPEFAAQYMQDDAEGAPAAPAFPAASVPSPFPQAAATPEPAPAMPDAVAGQTPADFSPVAPPLTQPVAPAQSQTASPSFPTLPLPQRAAQWEPQAPESRRDRYSGPEQTIQAPQLNRRGEPVASAPAAQAFAAPAPTLDPFQQANAMAERGFERQQQGITSAAEAEQRGAAEVASALEKRNADSAALEQERAKQAKQDLVEKQRLDREYGDAVKAYGEQKIDPKRLWNGMGTGKQIGVLVFQALAGVGSALTGHGDRNPALDLVQAKLAEDVQLQMAEREKMGQVVGLKGQQADRFSRLATDRGAEFQLRMAGATQRVMNDIEAIKAKTTSETVKARADQALGQLDITKSGFLENSASLQWNRDMQEKQFNEQVRARKAAAAQAAASLAQHRRDAEQAQANREQDRDDRIANAALERADKIAAAKASGNAAEAARLEKQADLQAKEGVYGFDGKLLSQPDGKMFRTGDEKRTSEIRAQMARGVTMMSKLDELDRLYAKNGGSLDVMNSDDNARARSLHAQLVLDAKEQAKLGVLSGGDERILNKMVGAADPNSYIKDPRAGYKAFREGIEAGVQSTLQANGFQNTKPTFPRLAGDALKGADDTEAGKLYREATTGPVRPSGRLSYPADEWNGISPDESSAAFVEGNTPVTDKQIAAVDGLAALASRPDGKSAMLKLVKGYLGENRSRLKERFAAGLIAAGIDPSDEATLRSLIGAP